MSEGSEKYRPPEASEQKIPERAPLGWVHRGMLVEQTGRSYKFLDGIIAKYRTEHPEWIVNYRSKRRQTEFYSPEFAKIISQEAKEFEYAPDGWQTFSGLASDLKTHLLLIRGIGESYRASNPEWFKNYLHSNGKTFEYYSPQLVGLIKSKISERKEAPKGWVVAFTLAKELEKASGTIQSIANQFRKEHSEWFYEYKTKTGVSEYFAPELVEKIRESIAGLPPKGWSTPSSLLKEKWAVTAYAVKAAAESYRASRPEWFKNFTGRGGGPREHYSPDLVEAIKSKLSEIVPEGWRTITDLYKVTKISWNKIKKIAELYRKSNPDWFKNYRTKEGTLEHLSPEMVAIVLAELTKAKEAPAGWLTTNALVVKTQRNQSFIQSFVQPYRKSNPIWFGKFRSRTGVKEHFSPELVALLSKELLKRKNEVLEVDESKLDANGIYTDVNGERWISAKQLKEDYKLHPRTIKEKLKGFKFLVGTSGGSKIYYKENEAVEVLDQLNKREAQLALVAERGRLEKELKGTLKEDVQEFRKLVGLFGASRFIDILYINHPQYKGMPVDRVKSIIAEYLGDFLAARHQINLTDLQDKVGYLSNSDIKEGLLEIMKDACLRFYHEQKKLNPNADDISIIREYIAKTKNETSSFANEDLLGVIGRVESYYVSIFEGFIKPDKIVNFVEEGREFPDANQLINIKEIQEKKKMLIADEMGLGKSASVILAKEYLGLKQALIVIPSNVIDTWQDYLSDKVGEDGKQIGYFKKGLAPKVLTVWDLESLRRDDVATFDYILISQERLNSTYTKELQNVNFDMMIVDEVHKLKNLESGRRSENLVSLSQKMEGEGKYLAMLSGTPVPNKVEDVAIILKLLYPEKFKDMENKDLIRSIIKGDLIDLRSLLVPRMQMKNLQESVEMPQLESQIVDVELNEFERDVYEALLEEDEITATQKIQIMRQFLMNPYLVDPTPGIDSSKIVAFSESIAKEFENKDKVVVFVNGYVEGVIRGENNILGKLNLPADIEIKVIEGGISKTLRRKIQKELNESNKKILLVINGQTADVGVDFTGGEAVDFYNEPWTKYDLAQQLSRVYRPGLKNDLVSKTFITKNTIEEGIHQYIETKQRAIEKLLKGVPITELERELLTQDEKQMDPNLEVNPELAEYYFTAWDRMMRIFSQVKEIGQESFIDYVAKYGREYASCYFNLGSRSYQANASRVIGTVVSNLVQESRQRPEDLKILDIASGPEMLKRHLPDNLQSRVFSMDINKHHFGDSGEKRVVGGFGNIPIESGSLDYANLSLALHYTKFIPSRQEFERLEVLMEMNRVLKEGGKAVINLIYSLDLKNEEKFFDLIGILGFKKVESYTGEVTVGKNYKSRVITLEKVRNIDLDLSELLKTMDRKNLEGLKFKTTDVKVKDTRRMFNQFKLVDKNLLVDFNTDDADVFEEEQAVNSLGKELKSEYGSIESIPRGTVIENDFVRFFDGSKYILFKKLQKGRGIVVIK